MKESKIALGSSPSRMERFRAADQSHQQMIDELSVIERIWQANAQTMDDRMEACIGIAASVFKFAKGAGLTPFAVAMANDLLLALGELHAGRHSELLRPGKVASNTPAPVDLAHQGMAHACVEILREAGLGATEARKEVEQYMVRAGFGKFSTHKLRALQTELTGPGSTSHPAFEFYTMAKQELARHLEPTMVVGQFHADAARIAIQAILVAARRRDHRA